MARRLATKEEAFAQRAVRTHGTLRILRDGRLVFGPGPGPDPSLEFRVSRYHLEGSGRWLYDSANYHVDVRQAGKSVLFLIVTRSRVRGASYNFTLEPHELRRGVASLRAFGRGVERWLAPGLERTRWSLQQGNGNPELLKVIPELLRSLRSVPRAVPPLATTAEEDTRVRMPPGKTNTATQPRKSQPRQRAR
ncbi:MAG TPA: hypothetical protein VK447_07550 [Myxococcaceae bacterium]|nr:hypothetical protein [Myxococcaceae bacterium]